MALPEVIGAAVETAFTYAKQEILAPGAGVAGTLVSQYLLKRTDEARQVVRSELERLGATPDDFKDAEQFAAAAFRFSRATRDQTADENLRLLVQAMLGLARRDTLWASEFLKYAEILAHLSRDELIVIGRLMTEDAAYHASVQTQKPKSTEPWKATLEGLTGANGGPAVFPTEAHVQAVGARAQRSGLIIGVSAWNATVYVLSPLGREMREFVQIEATLNHP